MAKFSDQFRVYINEGKRTECGERMSERKSKRKRFMRRNSLKENRKRVMCDLVVDCTKVPAQRERGGELNAILTDASVQSSRVDFDFVFVYAKERRRSKAYWFGYSVDTVNIVNRAATTHSRFSLYHSSG